MNPSGAMKNDISNKMRQAALFAAPETMVGNRLGGEGRPGGLCQRPLHDRCSQPLADVDKLKLREVTSHLADEASEGEKLMPVSVQKQNS